MVTARTVLTAMSLTGLLLTSAPGYPQSEPAQPGPDCSSRPEEPAPPVPGASGQQNADPRSSDCSRGQGNGSESNDDSEQENTMKSSESFAAAAVVLLTALAGGAASAEGVSRSDQRSLSLSYCRFEEPRQEREACYWQGGQYQCLPYKVPGSVGGEVCDVLTVVSDGAGSAGGSGGIEPTQVPCPSGKIGSGIDVNGSASGSASGYYTFKIIFNGGDVLNQGTGSFGDDPSLSDDDLWAVTGPQLPVGLCI